MDDREGRREAADRRTGGVAPVLLGGGRKTAGEAPPKMEADSYRESIFGLLQSLPGVCFWGLQGKRADGSIFAAEPWMDRCAVSYGFKRCSGESRNGPRPGQMCQLSGPRRLLRVLGRTSGGCVTQWSAPSPLTACSGWFTISLFSVQFRGPGLAYCLLGGGNDSSFLGSISAFDRVWSPH